jgi:hypothetical protein
MLKQYVAITEKQDEHEVSIFISSNCPLGMIHDSLFKMRSLIVEKINEAQKVDEENRKTFQQSQENVPEQEKAV